MGQCFGRECSVFFRKMSFRSRRGTDRYTQFAPKNKWKYTDANLLNELQENQSDEDLDFSPISDPDLEQTEENRNVIEIDRTEVFSTEESNSETTAIIS